MKDCHRQVADFERAKVRMGEDGRADIYGKTKTNRDRLRNGLAKRQKPKPVGFHTQGSYAMRTMIQHDEGDYDVDDGVYFAAEVLKGSNGGEMSALAVRQMVCEALQDDRFSDQPEVRTNCVRVYYYGGYHVDVPAYRRLVTKDVFGSESETYELASANWKKSDPKKVTNWFKDANATKSHDATSNGNDGQFVRIVRLVKAFARSRPHWSGKIAKGFAISKLVHDYFCPDEDRDDESLRETLKAIASTLAIYDVIRHPVLNENIAESGDPKTAFLRDKINEKLKHLEALDSDACTHETAMAAWDKFFYTDWFSNRPDPSAKSDVEKATGPAVIKKGEARYAAGSGAA
jgi:hypothetical protein